MPLISEMPRGREAAVETFTDPSSSPLLLHGKRTEGVSSCVRAAELDQDQDRCHRRFDEEDFGDFEQDECLDSDMEGSILHRPRPKKVVKAPVLPKRSEKRTSRILDNVLLELQKIDASRTKQEDLSRLDQEDPHELYLSSEEDASLSDDYEDSDSLLDFEETYSEDENGGPSTSRASSRRSQEITATVVSFMIVKPHIIEIHIPSNHTAPATPAEEKPDSMDALPTITMKAASPPAASQLRPAMRRPPPLNLQNARPMSMATTSSYIPSTYTPAMPTNSSMVNLSSTGSHPARKSSRLASLVTSTKASLSARSTSFSSSMSVSATSTHSFLDSDPFAQPANHSNPPLTPTDLYTPITPKTPTSQSSAWKKSLTRTLSKARKPSLQKINAAYNTSLSSTSNNNSTQRASTMSSATIPTLTRITSNPDPTTPKLFTGENTQGQDTEHGDRVIEVPVRRAETLPVTPSPREAPMRYEDLMRNRVPPPIPDNPSQQMPREGRKSFSLGMGLGRRKSLKRAS
ncbi:hypothetical protein IFR05_007300 [Cadophora sp. M221]|nr:hypothetical protein IFR05_007300 [Cadophora sp. M221]